ncbi:hypothetical protein KDD30_08335 [Photobacterium sp. GJ3]|uniref:hypothetical protein n=1 Tax=Photobacterium sp. GJ3 TaxID=2829502 RepID=UPI001B8D7E29|nr:hypothetical protein [Photobacterium sp. GJ3]QUJ66205.1 hypothetical protein KDD30_08335 [Photobacterium sp. GJ3]
MDEFLGCRRRERLQPARTTREKQKAFLDTLCASKEYLARIKKCCIRHCSQARHTRTTLDMQALNGFPPSRNADRLRKIKDLNDP